MPNAYAHSRTEGEFDQPVYSASENAYATSLTEDAPYADTFGWAPTLRLSPQGTPDGSRVGTQPRRDYRPDPGKPPQEFWGPVTAEHNIRHKTDEHIDRMLGQSKFRPGDADPALGARRWARNPRENPPPTTRPTQNTHPVMYFFTRPFDQTIARVFNGVHFSMADHRREYDILGMAPAKTRRNTYRIEPSPWDTDIVDMPPPDPSPDLSPVPGVNVADYGSGRSWRL